MSNEYVTVTELKYTLEISSAFADENIAAACEAASRTVDDLTGRRFYTTAADEVRYFTADSWTTYYRYVDGDVVGSTGSAVDLGDLKSVTEVAVDTDDNGTFNQVWVQDVDFRLEPYNAALDGRPWDRLALISAAGRSFPGYDRAIRVTGKFGWTPVPPAVKTATAMLAHTLLRRMREAPFGVVGVGIDNAAVRIPAVDPHVRMLLQPYVRTQVLV